MKLIVAINLDGAAFQGPDGGEEVCRVLEDLMRRVPSPIFPCDFALHDSSGEPCGYATIEASAEKRAAQRGARRGKPTGKVYNDRWECYRKP